MIAQSTLIACALCSVPCACASILNAAFLIQAMPNGHREHFRLGDGDVPSPTHTSDSDSTNHNKQRWALLARKVLHRWRAHVRRMKRARAAAALTSLRLVPQHWPGMVALLVVSFLI